MGYLLYTRDNQKFLADCWKHGAFDKCCNST